MCHHPHHLCFGGLWNFPSGTVEFQANRTQATHGGGEGGLCHRTETEAEMVIREQGCEHCMGAAAYI